MAIRIIAIGKKHELWVEGGIERYQKRLQKPFAAEWVLLPHSALGGPQARQEESERIYSRLSTDDFVVLLDERGEQLDSPTLARLFENTFQASARITVIIGGAYGVDKRLHDRANKVISLSPLVFPHQLVRLILTEQLYRCQEISAGRPYHHE